MKERTEMLFDRVLRSARESRATPIILTSILLAWLVWPLLLTPLMMDEVYGVIGIMGITPTSSLIDVLANPFTPDVYNFYLTDSGRIVPTGVIMYQGGYWLVSNVALLTGLHVATIYAFAKLGLLVLVALSLRALIRELLKGEKRGSLSTLLTLLVATVFVIGLRTDMATRNGLIVYPFLTYTAAIFTFLAPALLLRTLNKFRSPVAFYAASAVTAVLLALSYELHYVALFMAFIVLLFAPIDKSKIFAARWGAAILAIVSLVIQIRVRLLISDACNESQCYSGTTIVVNESLPGYLLNNLRGNLPGRGIQILQQAKKEGFVLDASFSVYLVIFLLLIILIKALFTLGKKHESPILVDDEFQSIRKLGYASLLAAGIAIVLTSLSSAAQEILKNPVPYRGYVLIWTLLSTGIVLITYSMASKNGHRRNVLIAASSIAILFGTYSLPYQQNGISLISSSENNRVFYDLHNQFFDPASDASSADYCKLVEDIGDSRRAQALRKNLNTVFEDLTGSKFCYPLPVVDEIKMPFIDR